jgi:hypothetical protein
MNERIKVFFNKFGGWMQMAINIVVFIIVAMEVFDLYDAIRFGYILMAIISFMVGILFLSNRWMVKIPSFIALVILVIFAGGDVDVNNIFVFLPFGLGMASQFMVFFRANQIDRNEDVMEETH